MNSAQFRMVVEPVINEIFDGLYAKGESQWEKLFEVKKGLDRRFQIDSRLVGFAVAPEKKEGAPIDYDQGRAGYNTRYTSKTYAYGFRLTEEMFEDGDHIDMAGTWTEHLALSMYERKELNHADVFNLAFSGTRLGGDNSPLLSATHARPDGNTWSNVLAVPADISVVGAQQMITQIKLAQNDRGILIGSIDVERMIVSQSDAYAARIVLESTLDPTGATNAKNVVADDVPELFILRRQTTGNHNWYMQTNIKDGLKHYWRAKVTRKSEGDFETGDMRYKSRERYAYGWTDPRCLYGSNAP